MNIDIHDEWPCLFSNCKFTFALGEEMREHTLKAHQNERFTVAMKKEFVQKRRMAWMLRQQAQPIDDVLFEHVPLQVFGRNDPCAVIWLSGENNDEGKYYDMDADFIEEEDYDKEIDLLSLPMFAPEYFLPLLTADDAEEVCGPSSPKCICVEEEVKYDPWAETSKDGEMYTALEEEFSGLDDAALCKAANKVEAALLEDEDEAIMCNAAQEIELAATVAEMKVVLKEDQEAKQYITDFLISLNEGTSTDASHAGTSNGKLLFNYKSGGDIRILIETLVKICLWQYVILMCRV